MPLPSAADLPTQSPQYWVDQHAHQLEWKLERTAELLTNAQPAEVQAHGRSYLALLKESQHYPQLTPAALNLIAQLHPLPVRWGWGHEWESQLRFALDHTPAENIPLRAEYMCGLAEVYLPVGRFEDAVQQGKTVLALNSLPANLAVRALRTLFTCYRLTGQAVLSDELMEISRERFLGDLPAEQVPPESAQAWLVYNTLQLELMREQGLLEPGLTLVDQMIWLDQRMGSPDILLTAELITFRSTFRWEVGRYWESVEDIQLAIDFFARGGDILNSESLFSNLGLVYWSIGELDLAEQSLNRAIGFYRKTGAAQLETYDIGNLGLINFARGELDQAMRLYEEHVAHARRLKFSSEMARGERNIPKIHFYKGRVEEALAALKASIPYFEKRGSRYSYYLNFLWMARCYKAQGRHDFARAEVERVMAWCQIDRPIVMVQLTLRCLADYLPLEEQEPLLLESLSLARKMGRLLEEAAVLLQLGRAAHDPLLGQQYWQQGVGLLQKQGAGAWLAGSSLEDPPFYPMMM